MIDWWHARKRLAETTKQGAELKINSHVGEKTLNQCEYASLPKITRRREMLRWKLSDEICALICCLRFLLPALSGIPLLILTSTGVLLW